MNRLTGKVKLTKTEERKFNKVLDNDDYSQITGVNLDHVEYTLATFPSPKFCYRNLDESEKDEIILAVQKKLTQTGLPLSGINDPLRWEKGWGEILEKVKNGLLKTDGGPANNGVLIGIPYNTTCNKEQLVEALIDSIILSHCSEINKSWNGSTFSSIGYIIKNLGFLSH